MWYVSIKGSWCVVVLDISFNDNLIIGVIFFYLSFFNICFSLVGNIYNDNKFCFMFDFSNSFLK